MSIQNMKKEELELLSYKDITHLLLTEQGKKNTPDIFRQIVDLLGLSEKTFETKIGDFYTSLTTDKRFVMLEDGCWDLRSNHTSDKVIKAPDDEDEEIEDVHDEEIDEETPEADFDSHEDDEEFDDSEEELKDLVVIGEDELELEQ